MSRRLKEGKKENAETRRALRSAEEEEGESKRGAKRIAPLERPSRGLWLELETKAELQDARAAAAETGIALSHVGSLGDETSRAGA